MKLKKGNILFWVIIVCMIIGLSFTALSVKILSIFRISSFRIEKIKSVALAESGVSDGIKRLLNDFEWQSKNRNEDFIKVRFKNNFYTLKCIRNFFPEKFTLEAGAKINYVNSRVTQEIILQTPLLYALFSTNRLFAGNETVINGNVRAGGIIDISENAKVEGNVLSSKYCRNYAGKKINCFDKTSVYNCEMPDLKQYAVLKDAVYVTDYKIQNIKFENKIVICRNGAEISSSTFTNCLLVVYGNLEIFDNNFFSAKDKYPAALIEKDLKITGKNNNVTGMIAAGSNAEIPGNLNLNGTLSANDIILTGKVNIVYDKSLYVNEVSGFTVKFFKTNFTLN